MGDGVFLREIDDGLWIMDDGVLLRELGMGSGEQGKILLCKLSSFLITHSLKERERGTGNRERGKIRLP
jgi:hypothetical protein